MKSGDWVILKHTTTNGTCIFPKIRRIRQIIGGEEIAFEDKEFPRTSKIVNVLASFGSAREARLALERGFNAWETQTAIVQAHELCADRARVQRLSIAIAAMKQGAPANA